MGTVRLRTDYIGREDEWMARAACVLDDPYLYDEIGDTKPPSDVSCFHCTVRAQCLTFGINHNFEGIWGGTTKKQRDTYSRKQRRAMCPGLDCRSREIRRGATADTCGSCGLSWPTTTYEVK